MNKELFDILDSAAKNFLTNASCVSGDELKRWVEDSNYAHLVQEVMDKKVNELTLKLAVDGLIANVEAEESKQLTLPGID